MGYYATNFSTKMNITIGISGNHGSGKSTLVKILSKEFNFDCVKFEPGLTSYLDDLFTAPDRWAFESQVAFLVSKVSQLIKAEDQNRNILLDRTIYEDINVFCKSFYNSGYLDHRGYNTYLELARLLLRNMTKPNFIIYCDCPLEVCRDRIKNRGLRDFEKKYNDDRLLNIQKGLESWLNSFNETPVIFLDTVKNDLRQPAIQNNIIADIRLISKFGAEDDSDPQLSFFEGNGNKSLRKRLKCLEIRDRIPSIKNYKTSFKKNQNAKVPINPFVYIAAPFTSEKNKLIDHYSLFPDLSTALIEKSYMDFLLSIEKCFRKYNFETILPHRDNSQWGKKPLDPAKLLDWCTVQVQQCSLVVSIPSTSPGVHYELGLAKAWRKPMILLEKSDKSDSKMSRGFINQIDTLKLSYDNQSEIPDILLGTEVSAFIGSLGLA